MGNDQLVSPWLIAWLNETYQVEEIGSIFLLFQRPSHKEYTNTREEEWMSWLALWLRRTEVAYLGASNLKFNHRFGLLNFDRSSILSACFLQEIANISDLFRLEDSFVRFGFYRRGGRWMHRVCALPFSWLNWKTEWKLLLELDPTPAEDWWTDSCPINPRVDVPWFMADVHWLLRCSILQSHGYFPSFLVSHWFIWTLERNPNPLGDSWIRSIGSSSRANLANANQVVSIKWAWLPRRRQFWMRRRRMLILIFRIYSSMKSWYRFLHHVMIMSLD